MIETHKLADFHAHILPGADHGSDSVETSLEQLRLLCAAGVDRVVATPHFYPNADSVASFLEKRRMSEKLLCGAGHAAPVTVYRGAEVLVCAGLDRMPGLESLCIEGTDVLLLEMPFSKWSEELFETVYNISSSSRFRVIMAHIGRYPTAHAERLVTECGVAVQLNGEDAASLIGKKNIDKWLRRGCVAAFGSDIHGNSHDAPKNLVRLYNRAGKYALEVINKTNELLSGADALEFADRKL